ncbi:MAG TPA: hypothetical protein VIL17_04195 [Coriobacteriia bacterium]
MTPRDDFADELAEQMRDEAKRRGIDPSLVQEKDVQVNREDSTIRIKWKDVDIAMPAPSRDAVDAWFTQNGQVIAGSVLTLAGVVVGGAIAIATGKSSGLKQG